MSKYFKYTPSQNEFTTLRFQDDGAHNLIINTFDTNVVLMDGDATQISDLQKKQPPEIAFTEIALEEFIALASKSAQAKFALETLAKKFKEQCDLISANASIDESLSWPKQEALANTFLADQTKKNIPLENLATARGKGETVLELANKIITNADLYAQAYMSILGEYQAAKKAVFAPHDTKLQ